MDFSLAVYSRSNRNSTYITRFKDHIRRRGALCPDGADKVGWTTKNIGGDAEIQFTIPDPGHKSLWRVRQEEVVDLFLGPNRLCQGIADEVPKRVPASGELDYSITGHFPWRAKKDLAYHAAGSFPIDTWFIGMIFDNANDWGATTWIKDLHSTWVNDSRNFVTTGLSWVQLDLSGYETSEKFFQDLLQFIDYELGMFPGPDSPASLGCYIYLKPRLINKIDWILKRSDFLGIDDPIDIDLAYDYYNQVVYKWTRSDNSQAIAGLVNQPSADLYTPGSYAMAWLDLTSGNGWMSDTNAATCAQAFLDLHDGTVPMARGTVVVPFGYIEHTTKGLQHSAFIRAGDNICIPHLDCYQFDTSTAKSTIDNRTVFHVYEAAGDVGASTMTLQVGIEPSQLDALISNMMMPTR